MNARQGEFKAVAWSCHSAWAFLMQLRHSYNACLHDGPYSSFRFKTRFWGQNDKNLNNCSVTTSMASRLEDNHFRLNEILGQKFIFIQCQFMELSNSVFVAVVTSLQALFRLLHPSAKS